MELFDGMFDSGIPVLTVFLLGLLVSVCPCTMAANVSALSCMLRQNRGTFWSLSSIYILARTIIYTLVGVVLYYFAESIEVTQSVLSIIGKVAGPLFLIIGLLLLDIIHIHGLENRCVLWMNKIFKESYSMWSAFLLGLLLAFAFCPYSAAIYFGVMIPLSCTVSYGVFLPLLFSIGAALPLFFVSYLLNNGIEKKKDVWDKFQKFEFWFRKIVAVIFIITGILFIWEYYLE